MRHVALPLVAALSLALALPLGGCSSSSKTSGGEGPDAGGDTGLPGTGDSATGADAPGGDSTSGGPDGGAGGDATAGDTNEGDSAPFTFDAAVPATCPQTFTLPDNGYTTVLFQADYLMWMNGLPMTKGASGWSITTPVPYGTDVQYKFEADGTWMPNPGEPTVSLPSISSGTNVNNIMEGMTCGHPAAGALQLVGGAVTTTATSYSFQVQWNPGGAPLDPSKTIITLNGAPVPASAVPYDASTHTFSVSVTSGITAPNKYGYVFQVEDMAGNPARIFVPFWVQSTDFEWLDSFMYEIMVDRFVASGTTSKAGPNGSPTDPVGDWKGGDFGGVTQKIAAGYFDAMGVNTLWLSSPVLGTKLCEEGSGANSGHCLSGYHSYFPIASGWTYGSESDPLFTGAGITTAIEPHFGVLSDLQTLVNTAHQHGIRVLTDLVVNHVFADSSPPAGQSPQVGPLWTAHQSDLAWFNIPYTSGTNDCGNENLWDTPTSSTWNRADCWFDPYLPDLNSTNPRVDDSLAEHAIWLMEQLNLDGFRVDAIKQMTNNVCLDMRAKIGADISTGLPFYMVGEALGSDQANVFDCVGDNKFNGSMDDTLHNTIIGTILQNDANGAQDLYNGVVADEGSGWTGSVPGAIMGHFFGSHDTPRAISLAASSTAQYGDSNGNPWSGAPPAQETDPLVFSRLQLAQTFLLTYDSIPVIWMGDEFGQPGTIDPDCRRMMRFGTALSGQEQATLTHLQKLGTARAAHSALRRGPRTNLWVDSTFYADGRVDGTDITVVALNLGTTQVTRTMSVTNIGLTVPLTDVLSGTTVTPSGGMLTITLPPLTSAVFTE